MDKSVLGLSRQGWFGFLLILSMTGLTVVASQLPPPQFEPVGARIMAMTVPLVLIFLGLVLLVQDFRRPPAVAAKADADAKSAVLGPAALYGLLLIYAALVAMGLDKWLYVAVSTLFAALAAGLISEPPRRAKILQATLTALVLSGGIAWSFSTLLYVDIAR